MILGFHLIWTTYGHWFPNDPRGSWSQEVWKPELHELRAIDEVRNTVRTTPVEPEILRAFLDSARSRLKWDVVCLAPAEVEAVGSGFGEVATAIDLKVWACAILTNHVHLVIERHGLSFERIVNRLKGQTGQRVRAIRGYPAAKTRAERIPIWSQKYWVRFIDQSVKMVNAVSYVKENLPEGMSQDWPFVR